MVFVFWQRPGPALLSAPVQYEGALATLAQGAGIPVLPGGDLTQERVPPVPA